MTALSAWLEAARAEVDAAFADLFHDAWPAPFLDALRYPLFTGGKRVRPALVFAAHEAVSGGTDRALAIPAAVAVELVHTYSLVHDDLPAMDDDDERRGRPTVHVAFDEPTAILVGDALLTEAFAVIARAELPGDVRAALVRNLADAAGYKGMIGGQAADVGLGGPVTSLEALTRLHRGKTGALIESAVLAGALVAGADAPTRDALHRYGRAVGLAFQLADDVLDDEEDAGEDGPPSYTKLLGRDETLARATALADEACAVVADLPAPAVLQALARYTVERDR